MNEKGSPKNLKPAWKVGQPSPNPGGKPIGARNRVTKKFLENLADDFEAHGKDAIIAARESDPMGYVKAIVALLPKEYTIERPTDGLSDDELAAAISELRQRLTVVEGPGNGMGQAEVEESAGVLSTVSKTTGLPH